MFLKSLTIHNDVLNMYNRSCCSFRGRRYVSASLASAGLLGCFYSKLLLIPVCIESFSAAERSTSIQALRENRLHFTSHRYPMQRLSYLYKMRDSGAFPGLSGSSIPDQKSRRSLQTTKAISNYSDTPQWVRDAFSVTHNSFEKKRDAYVPDLGLAASFYKHKDTGLSVISVVTDDSGGREMCFDIVVPTPPFNDSGCPHILEHSVLEGSKNYPGKNGFALLLQGGFHSFVNALTDKDRTSYLFASTNEKDFYVTADYYMSAIFQPNIRKHERIFKQEAWHYRVSDSKERTGLEGDGIELHGRQISYGGIVYSEMKKAYSDPISRGQDYIYQRLFTNAYRFDSGGNPENIVRLQYPELLDFYGKYYGPKTASVYFYGPNDPHKRLVFVDDYLRKNEITSSESLYPASLEMSERQVKPEKYREINEFVCDTFAASGTQEEDIIFTGWLLDPVYVGKSHGDGDRGYLELDLVDALGMEALEYLLIGTPESLLHKALIKSNLGKKVVGSGLTNHFNQANFIVGLSGISCNDELSKDEARKKFESVLASTFAHVVQNGFKGAAIDAALNTIEFQMREFNTGSFPKGLMLVHLMHSQLQFGKDPVAPLYFGSLMESLRKRISEHSNYFSTLVKKHFVDNKHRVTVHMNAIDPQEFEKSYNEKIKMSLMNQLAHLSEKEVSEMELDYQKFKAENDKPEDPRIAEALPVLSLNDINPSNETIPTVYYILGDPHEYESMPESRTDDILALLHPIESHGIIYMDLAISLEDLNLSELIYLDIFASMIKEAGTYERCPEDMSYHIASNLGGLSVTFSFMTPANGRRYSNRNSATGHLYVRAKALKDKANDMLDIMLDLLSNANFSNKEKGMEIIRRRIHQMHKKIISEGHSFASKRLMSRLSVADYANEVCSGYEYLKQLEGEIQHHAEENWTAVASKLENIKEKICCVKNVKVNITASSDMGKSWLKHETQSIAGRLKETFKTGPAIYQTNKWVSEVINKGYSRKIDEVIVAPTNVNFVGMGGPLFNEDEISGADALFIHYLRSSYLWKHIRVSLGAYGVFCNISACGDVIFMSYADPNFDDTLRVYKDIPRAVKEMIGSINDKEFLRQKIGEISRLDKPLTVDAKGFTALNRIIRGESDQDRQVYRDDLIGANVDCFNRLLDRMSNNEEWHNVCAVVNRTTAGSLPSTIAQLSTLN